MSSDFNDMTSEQRPAPMQKARAPIAYWPKAWKDTYDERIAQNQKWGDQSGHSNGIWLSVLTEEVGEVAKAMLEGAGTGCPPDDFDLRDELIQVAAVAIAWAEAIDWNTESCEGATLRGGWYDKPRER